MDRDCERLRLEGGYRILLGAVVSLTWAWGATVPKTATAQELTTNTPLCHIQKFRVPGWRGALDDYSVKAKTLPPERVMNPGETYQIRYEIVTACELNWNCVDVLPATLIHRAVLGADRSQLDRTKHGTGTTHVEQHRCGVVPTRIVTFTVPDPKTLGAGRNTEVTVSMGICPPDSRWNCAGHTIKVRNAPIGVWEVSAPHVGVRTISGALPAERPIPMRVDVSNYSGYHRWPEQPGALIVQATGAFPTIVVATLDLPSVSDLQRTSVSFSVTPDAPGTYLYRACLIGLNDVNGWPLPQTCGPFTSVSVGPPAQGSSAAPGGPSPPQAAPAPQGDAAPPKFGVLPQLQPLPPAPAPAPQAAAPAPQAAPASPPTGQFECRGGEVRGILCWCGIGRFPKALGGNVYQCQ